jgi:putative oxidoreductase
VTTDDNRSRAAGGYSDSGLFDREKDGDFGRRSDAEFDEAGYSSQQTTVLSGSGGGFDSDFDSDFGEEPVRRTASWHGGLDFGLLVLRLVLGGMFVAHGLDMLFGWFDGLGRGGTQDLLTGYGFHDVGILTWVLSISETAAGALLVLGLFTPAAAAAILAIMANVIVVKGDWSRFLGNVELEMMFAGASFALLFTGPGRISLDRNTPWFRRAPAFGFVGLIIAGGATAVTLLVFR